MNKEKLSRGFILSTMIGLYVIVSIISTIHVIEFFKLSNPNWLAISLAIAFEIGAAASLASIIVLEKTNKYLVWALFLLLTGMQMQGNMFYAYTNLENFEGWIELFGLQEEELMTQKRILSIVSGAILPIIALGFIKSLVDYIKPSEVNLIKPETQESLIQESPVILQEVIPTKITEVKKIKPISSNIEEIQTEKIQNDIINETELTKEDTNLFKSVKELEPIPNEIIETADKASSIINETKIGDVKVSSKPIIKKKHVYKP